jgi:phosphate acetyltransferase
MVSGADGTTADTIRPALSIIKTKPGCSIASSVFLMCLADRVWVFGDCAINPNPNPQQLAEIAIISAQTAKAFGVDPKVAMLSYSTGTSGTGPDVDMVKEATAIARESAEKLYPGLAIDGPLQFDAAVDPKTGASKMPGSPVAGQATVMIFPDLGAGNIGYKAVQRTAKAVAIGPIIQGLNAPVNDLSRGTLVADIINTVAITALQAMADK